MAKTGFWLQQARRVHAALMCGCVACSGCALKTRPGDGLVTDGPVATDVFASASSGNGKAADAGGGLRSCAEVELFSEQVIPHFIERCIECHDGTKLKAVLALDLFEAKSDDAESQQYTCDITLTQGVNVDDLLESPMLTSVDPDRPDKEHEFKYPDAESFSIYRDAVLVWAETE